MKAEEKSNHHEADARIVDGAEGEQGPQPFKIEGCESHPLQERRKLKQPLGKRR